MMTLNDFIVGDTIVIEGIDIQGELTWAPGVLVPDIGYISIVDTTGHIDFDNISMYSDEADQERDSQPAETMVSVVGGAGTIFGLNLNGNFRNWGVDIRGGWTVTDSSIDGFRIGVLLRHFDSALRDSKVSRCTEDHVRVMSGYTTVFNNRLIEHPELYGPEVHKDLIQVVGANYGSRDLVDNPITSVFVGDNTGFSTHPEAQGIMVSDGVLIDSQIQNNYMEVPSTHGVTLNRGHNVSLLNNVCGQINIGSRKQTTAQNMSIGLTDNTCDKLVIYPDSDVNIVSGNHGEVVYLD